MLDQEIERNFTFHPPKPGQPERYEKIRAEAKKLAYLLNEECLPSREKSLALTNLEQAVFWANAAIARNETRGAELTPEQRSEPDETRDAAPKRSKKSKIMSESRYDVGREPDRPIDGTEIGKPLPLCRWWLRSRPAGNAIHISGSDLEPVAEFYVPWWAWEFELTHRLAFGTQKIRSYRTIKLNIDEADCSTEGENAFLESVAKNER